jgi:hypothetical protein
MNLFTYSTYVGSLADWAKAINDLQHKPFQQTFRLRRSSLINPSTYLTNMSSLVNQAEAVNDL